MKRFFTNFLLPCLGSFSIILLGSLDMQAQTVTHTECHTFAPTYAVANTGLTGAATPAVLNFSTAPIPAGHVITEMYVEVVWSKTNGGCSSPTAGPVDLSEVGFSLTPNTGGTIYFAPSAQLAAIPAIGAPGPTFNGTNQVLNNTTTFSNSVTTAFPIGTPVNGDTIGTNGPTLTAGGDLLGTPPFVNFTFAAINDDGGTGPIPPLCIESVCVTLVTCPGNLVAQCQANITLPLDNTGNLELAFDDLNNGSDTSCLLDAVTFTPNNFTCADANTTVAVTMELTDNLGNTDNCISNVTIEDNIDPNVVCEDYIAFLDAGGSFNFVASDSVVTSDNCGIAPGGVTIDGNPSRLFTCAQAGLSPLVFIEVTDVNGNSTNCIQRIEVRDTISPNAVCFGNITTPTPVYLDGTGVYGLPANDIDGGSTDNCSVITTRLINGNSSFQYTCTDLGLNNATLVVGDQSGNLDSCTAVVEVFDTISPVMACANPTVYLNPAGNVTVNATLLDGGVSDNCTNFTLDVNGGASINFDCSHVGTPQVVTLTATDGSTNQNTCSATITVEDTIAPVTICQNPTVYLDNAGSVTVVPLDVDNGSNDVCTGAAVTYAFSTGGNLTYDCTAVGVPQSATLEVTDTYGNTGTCNATITVEDTISPNAVCQPFTAHVGVGGNASVLPSDIDNGSNDNCGVTTYLINGTTSALFNCAAIGTPQTVTLRVEDAEGNFDECTETVTVLDTVSPNAICQNRTVTLNALGTATVTANQINNLSSDNCNTISLLINGAASVDYDCDSIGTRTAVLTVTDQYSNQSTCTATITVEDDTDPIPVCSNQNVFVSPTGSVTINASTIDGGSSDNCGPLSLLINGQNSVTYTCDSLASLVGPLTAALTVEDGSGNQATCNATINVQDTVSPTANCIGIITVALDPSGNAVVHPSDINLGSSDNCGPITFTVNGLDSVIYTCANVLTNPNTISLEVEDAANNVTTCTAQVTVEDNIDPTAVCANDTFYVDATGQVVVNASDIDGGSSDNCGPTTLSINTVGNTSVTYFCADVGVNNATLIVEDASGGVDVCVAQITILDTISPVANCQGSLDVFLTNSGTVNVLAAEIDNTSTDNCAITDYFIDGGSFATYDCTDVGTPQTAVLTVEDGSNNQDVCNATINVQDTFPPVATCQNITASITPTGDVTVAATAIDGGSTDNCGTLNYYINTVGNPDITYTCLNVGNNTVTLIVEDANGNQDNCTATITVEDNTAPDVTCLSNVDLFLDNTGIVNVSLADVGTATDNCNLVSALISPTSFTCANTGSQTVTITATDGGGLVSTCNASVNVLDTIDPVATCQNIVVSVGATGSVTVPATDIDNGSSDICGITSYDLSEGTNPFGPTITYTCTDIGIHNVTLQVTDNNGNTNTCAATIDVLDNQAPSAVCQNITVSLDPVTGLATVLATDIDDNSSDNCTTLNYYVGTIGTTDTTFDCSNIGNNTISLIVEDAANNRDTCFAVVDVQDITPPTAVCQPNVTLYLDNTGNLNVLASDIDAGSIDACGIATSSVSPASFDCNSIGIQTVTLTITDNNGLTNTCTSNITVEDTIAPVVVCTNGTFSLDNTGILNLSPSDVGSATDACTIQGESISDGGPFASNLVFTCADIGVVNITYQATDANGVSATCVAAVTIEDNNPPTLTCSNTLTVQLNAQGQYILAPSDLVLTDSDNCGTTTLTINGQPDTTMTCADVGTGNVTIISTDAGGNQSNCTAAVTVQDVTPPAALCNNATVYVDNAGVVTVTPPMIDAGSFDSCGIVSMTVTPNSFDCNDIGNNNTVTLEVTDVNGLVGTCTSNILVEDTLAPVLVCVDDTVYIDPSGIVSVLATDIGGGTTDNCLLQNVQIRAAGQANFSSNVIFDCTDVGTQTVTILATDVYANSDSCTATVTVRDTTGPIANCNTPVTIELAPAGTATVNATFFDNGSSDNCGVISSYLVDGQPNITFDCLDITAPQTVTLTVFDNDNNSSTCQSVVTVLDTTAPVASCINNLSLNLDFINGVANLNAITLDNGSTDECGALSYSINGQSTYQFTCAEVGLNTVFMVVEDGSGNVDSCSTDVTINDIHNPIANCVSSITLPLDTMGVAELVVSDVDNGSVDNCGIASFQINGLDTVTYSCADIGNIPETITLSDPSGNQANCTVVVQVVDTTPPVAICPTNPVQVYVDGTGNVTVPAIDIDSASYDNCAITQYRINNAPSVIFNCSQLGFQTVTLRVRDGANLTSTCTTTIEVIDSTSPVASCGTVNASLNSNGIAIVNATSLNNGSSDNCSLSASGFLINGQLTDTFTCANVGLNNAVLTVTDDSGNQSFCTGQVNVIDNTAPSITCTSTSITPLTFYLDAAGEVIVPATSIATTTDNCGTSALSINGQIDTTFTCAHTGTQSVQVVATDQGGLTSSCTAVVIVEDSISPTASCQNITVSLNAAGTVDVLPSDIDNMSLDNCGIQNLLIDGFTSVTYTCAEVGTNQATLIVIDSNNNQSLCVATVTVVDDIDPVANCQTSITVQLSAAGDATVNAISLDNGSTDNCSPLDFFIAGNSSISYNCSNIGSNPVLLEVVDPSGNTDVCSSIVEIVDGTAPVADCQTNIDLYLDNTGFGEIFPSDVDLNSFDNCGAINLSLNTIGTTNAQFDCTDIGGASVDLIVTDISGNADTCTTTVTVLDTISPTISCVNSIIDLSATGPVALSPNTLINSVNDACGIDTLLLSQDSIDCSDVGQVQVVVTAVDIYNNQSFCVSTIDVILDNFTPTTTSPASAPLCEGSNIVLFSNPPAGTYTYSWTGPNGFTATTQDVTVTNNSDSSHIGTYYITLTPVSGAGCPSTDSVEVGVNVVPPPVLATFSSPVCEGDSATIFIDNISDYSGNTFTYTWSLDGTQITNNSDVLTLNPVIPADQGNYSVIIDIDGCIDSSDVDLFLNVNPLPGAPIPSADTICVGDTLTLFANPQGVGPFSFNWAGPNNFTSTDQNPIINGVTLADIGTYTVTVSDDSTCTASTPLVIDIKPLPITPELNYNIPLCIGDVLELTDTTVYAAGTNYYWTLADTATATTTIGQFLVSDANEGVYTLQVETDGCFSFIDTVDVAYELVPEAFMDNYTLDFRDSLIGFDVMFNDATTNLVTVSIVDSANGGTLVNLGDGTFNYVPNYSYFGLDTFTYSICDVNCPSSCDTALVILDIRTDFECFIPNAISPNGDGINDIFNVRCVNEYPDAEMEVFSRWGNRVYAGTMDGFDGTFKGQFLPDGTYFYVLKLNDTTHVPNDRYSGFIILRR